MKRTIVNVPALRHSCEQLARQFRQQQVLTQECNLSLVDDVSGAFNYYKQVRLSLRILAKITTQQYPQAKSIDHNHLHVTPYILAVHDLNRVAYPIAATAWLTTDQFCWHKVKGYESVPEDLSYGLVQQYFSPVVEATRFFLLPTGKQRHHLSPAERQEARKFAINVVQKVYSSKIRESDLSWHLVSDP